MYGKGVSLCIWYTIYGTGWVHIINCAENYAALCDQAILSCKL